MLLTLTFYCNPVIWKVEVKEKLFLVSQPIKTTLLFKYNTVFD